jgi:hypothetical protein
MGISAVAAVFAIGVAAFLPRAVPTPVPVAPVPDEEPVGAPQ